MTLRSGIIPSPWTECLGAGTGVGTSVTTAAGSKSSYTTIGTAGFGYDGINIGIAPSSRRNRVDLAYNAGGSDTVILEDFPANLENTGQLGWSQVIDVAIPSGATIKARGQANTGTGPFFILLNGINRGELAPRTFSRLRSFTDWTAADPTGTVTQNGTSFTASWTTLCASTPCATSRLLFWITHAADASLTASNMLFKIAIGAAASEVELPDRLQFTQNSTYGSTCPYEMWHYIPAGTRLSFKVQCSAAAADTIGLICCAYEY